MFYQRIISKILYHDVIYSSQHPLFSHHSASVYFIDGVIAKVSTPKFYYQIGRARHNLENNELCNMLFSFPTVAFEIDYIEKIENSVFTYGFKKKKRVQSLFLDIDHAYTTFVNHFDDETIGLDLPYEAYVKAQYLLSLESKKETK